MHEKAVSRKQIEAGAVVLTIRDLQTCDRTAWEPLWLDYQKFYGVALGTDVTASTWRQLLDDGRPVRGLGAFGGDRMLGLAHFLFHRSTWRSGGVCYLQDLYVVPDARRQGLARQLIEAVYAAADSAGVRQVYWLTHASNAAARKVYDRLRTTHTNP